MYKCLNLQTAHAFRFACLPTCRYCDVAYVIHISEASMGALPQTKWF